MDFWGIEDFLPPFCGSQCLKGICNDHQNLGAGMGNFYSSTGTAKPDDVITVVQYKVVQQDSDKYGLYIKLVIFILKINSFTFPPNLYSIC